MTDKKILAGDFKRKAEDGESVTRWYKYNADIELVWCSDAERDWSAYDNANDRVTREYESRAELTEALDNNSVEWIEAETLKYKAYIEIEGREDVGEQAVYLDAEDRDQAIIKITSGISKLYNCEVEAIQIYNLASELQNPEGVKDRVCGWEAGKPIAWDENPLILK